jgi:hypothetical protein
MDKGWKYTYQKKEGIKKKLGGTLFHSKNVKKPLWKYARTSYLWLNRAETNYKSHGIVAFYELHCKKTHFKK